MTKHKHRLYIVADAAGADWFREYARDTLGDDGWETVCRTPLAGRADDKAEPTHWCASFVATDEQAAELDALKGAGKLPAGVKLTRVDARRGPDRGKVLSSTDARLVAKTGQRLDAKAVFEEFGLVAHRKEAKIEADVKPDKGGEKK